MTATIYPLRRSPWQYRAALATKGAGGKKAPSASEPETDPRPTVSDAREAENREILDAARAIRRYGPWLWGAIGSLFVPLLGFGVYTVTQLHDLDKRLVTLEASFKDHKDNHNHLWSQPSAEPVPGPNPPPGPSVRQPSPPLVEAKTEHDLVPPPRAVPSSIPRREPPICVHSTLHRAFPCEQATECVGSEGFKPDNFRRIRRQAGFDDTTWIMICDEKAKTPKEATSAIP